MEKADISIDQAVYEFREAIRRQLYSLAGEAIHRWRSAVDACLAEAAPIEGEKFNSLVMKRPLHLRESLIGSYLRILGYRGAVYRCLFYKLSAGVSEGVGTLNRGIAGGFLYITEQDYIKPGPRFPPPPGQQFVDRFISDYLSCRVQEHVTPWITEWPSGEKPWGWTDGQWEARRQS